MAEECDSVSYTTRMMMSRGTTGGVTRVVRDKESHNMSGVARINIWRNKYEPIITTAAEGAILVGRGCSLWRGHHMSQSWPRRPMHILHDQHEPVMASAAEGATHGATNRSQSYHRRPRGRSQ